MTTTKRPTEATLRHQAEHRKLNRDSSSTHTLRRLQNGRTILAYAPDPQDSDWFIVLARIDRPGNRSEYVTWNSDADGNTTSGHYFSDYDGAFDSFVFRIKS